MSCAILMNFDMLRVRGDDLLSPI